MIEIRAVGGYNEVGKNMTAVRVDDDVVVLDMGLFLDSYIRCTQDEDAVNISPSELIKAGAVPDVSQIDDWKSKVKAIIPTHAHLDHVGAIPFLANGYKAEILGTPYTTEVLKTILRDEKIKFKNPIKTLSPNSVYQVSKGLKVEFINVTHSTPQTVMVALHTKYGTIIYANDFKFDRHPVLGTKPNFKRLKQIGEKGVLALIVDSTYANDARKTPSETVAREMLRDVMLGTNSKGKAVIVTTFSSHLARLKSIIEFGRTLDRKIIFLGRSLSKYVEAGENIGLIKFSGEVKLVKYKKQIKRELKTVMEKGKDKYLLVVTGHQGEPDSTLSRMVDEKMNFRFTSEDHVIFSCTVIPTPLNRANREYLENSLRQYGVRIFKDIHVSGHAAREDLRDLINLVKPKHVIPAHGEPRMTEGLYDLAREMGYSNGHVHHMRNGRKLILETKKI
ncbi:MAG: RNase J family beta-CASP ribonuclease [archaeon]